MQLIQLLTGLGVVALTATAQDGADIARPALTRYTVASERSEVGFDGTSTLHDFTGRTRAVTGALFTQPTAPTVFASGWVECRAATLDTDNGSRDEKLREHLDVEHFPLIRFGLARAEAARPGALEVDLAGAFAIHGVEREYHFTVTSELAEDGALRVRGRAPLKLTDHGIVPPKVVLIEVGDAVEVWFDLTLVPVAEEELDARGFRVDVVERLTPAGGAPVEATRAEQLFVTDAATLWERPSDGAWLIHDGAHGARRLQVTTASVADLPTTSEESFAEARDTMARLREKLDKLEGAKRERAERAVTDTLTRLASVLAHAPAEGPLERTEVADGEVWSLGGTTWLELHGRRGAGNVASLLTCLDGVPATVREALGQHQGVPERMSVRTATMGGVRTLELRFAAPTPARLPRWVLDAEGGVRR